MEPMSETPPRHRSRIIAIVLVLILIGAVPSAYLVFYSSQPKKMPSHGFTVNSNIVIALKIPGYQYSIGIWQLQLNNPGNSNLYATYQILVNGILGYGNTTVLVPGQQTTVTSCLIGPVKQSTSFDVPIFLTNSSGTVVPHYSVTLVNTTQVQFSGQFSATNSLHALVLENTPQTKRNVSTWSVSVSNLGQKPIQFLYAALWNGTQLIASNGLRCAGSVQFSILGLPATYGQALSSGESVNGTHSIQPANSLIKPGRTYRVDVIAVYSDYSEVVQSYQVQATS
jgi:hypothetical protein